MKGEILLIILFALAMVGLVASAPPPLPGEDCITGTSAFGISGQVAHDGTLITLGEPTHDLFSSGDYTIGNGCLLYGDTLDLAFYAPSPSSRVLNISIVEYTLTPTTWTIGNVTHHTENVTNPDASASISPSVYDGERASLVLTVPSSSTLDYVSVSYNGTSFVLYHETPALLILLGDTAGSALGFYLGILAIAFVSFTLASILARIFVERTRMIPKLKRRTVLLVVAIFVTPVMVVLGEWTSFSLVAGTTTSYFLIIVPFFLLALLTQSQLHRGDYVTVGVMRAIPAASQRTIKLSKTWTSKKGGKKSDLLYRWEPTKKGSKDETTAPGKWVPVKRDGFFKTTRTLVQTDTMPYIEGRSVTLTKGDDGIYRWNAPGFDAWLLRLFFGTAKVDPVWDDRRLIEYPLRYMIAGLPYDWWVLHAYPQEPILRPTRFRLWKKTLIVTPTPATPLVPNTSASPGDQPKPNGTPPVPADDTEPRYERKWWVLEPGEAGAFCFGAESASKILEFLFTQGDMVSLAVAFEAKCEENIRLRGELPKKADEWTESRVRSFMEIMLGERRPLTPDEEAELAKETKRARASYYKENLQGGGRDATG